MKPLDSPALDPVADKWRRLLLDVLEPVADDTPLLLSGGADSLTLLAGLMILGRRPRCYTFRVGDRDSRDARVARLVARTFELDHRVVTITRDYETLVEDIRTIVTRIGVTGKASVQCCQPTLWLARAVRADGYRDALIGTGGIVEDNRKGMVILHGQGEAAARVYRREQLLGSAPSATKDMYRIAASEGVTLFEPYSRGDFAEYALSLDMREINRPRQKGITLRAFPGFWGRGAFVTERDSLQVGSGVRQWHQVLLTSEYNTRGWRQVVGVYREMYRQFTETVAEPDL